MIKLTSILLENSKPRYSGVVIDDVSKNLLIKTFRQLIPADWEVIAHHMTINPFGLVDVSEVGKPVTLTVTEVGKSDKALAVKVSGYNGKTKNSFPHITIAIDRVGGAKPKDSNVIEHWKVVGEPIILNGIIKNI